MEYDIKVECCVFGCKNSAEQRYSSPKRNQRIFKMLIKKTKPFDCKELCGQCIYREYFVCHDHFVDRYHSPKSASNAIPTIGIPGGRKFVLRKLNIAGYSTLTPEAKILYLVLKEHIRMMNLTELKCISFKDRLALAKKVMFSKLFKHFLKYANKSANTFFKCQFLRHPGKENSRTFTVYEKRSALALFSSCPKGYRLLVEIFELPSVRTMRKILTNLPFVPGINHKIFEHLKCTVKRMRKRQDKVCVLMFDEVVLRTNLKYDGFLDEIIGIEDHGTERQALLADHATVFFLRAVNSKWIQPVAFTFSQGPIKASKLKELIEEVIRECRNVGLQVLVTICDQAVANQAAIKMLLEERKELCAEKNIEDSYFGFFVDNREVLPLFDTSHLFKGLRNHLIHKHASFKCDGVPKLAKWSHIEKLYEFNNLKPSQGRILYKLTDAHVIPERINKTKIEMCTQVFSRTVGVIFKNFAQCGKIIPRDSEDTGDLIIFLDHLFDSLHSMKFKEEYKPLKTPITKKSIHEKFWQYAIGFLNDMQFFCPQRRKYLVVPSLKNLIHSIRGISYLRSKLLFERNFTFFRSGVLSLDKLNIFLRRICSNKVERPDIAQFVTSFKSLILNDIRPTWTYYYYGIEKPAGYLDNLKSFLTSENQTSIILQYETSDPIPELITFENSIKLAECEVAHMSTTIRKLILKNKSIKKCQLCKNKLLLNHSHKRRLYHVELEQNVHSLMYITRQHVQFLISNSLSYLFYAIPRICEKRQISKHLRSTLMANFNFKVLNCPNHDLGTKLCDAIIKCSLIQWCRQVNKILKGSGYKFSRFLARNPSDKSIDPIKLQAKTYFHKINRKR